MFGRKGLAAARAALAVMAVALSMPRGAVLAASPRDAALHELTQGLDETVSWCVTQFDALQHQYIAYRDATGAAPTQADVANAQAACLGTSQRIPPVLQRYAAVAHMLHDWTDVLQQFEAATADIDGVVFMDMNRAAADSDVVRRLRLANNLAVEANNLTLQIARSWHLRDGR